MWKGVSGALPRQTAPKIRFAEFASQVQKFMLQLMVLR